MVTFYGIFIHFWKFCAVIGKLYDGLTIWENSISIISDNYDNVNTNLFWNDAFFYTQIETWTGVTYTYQPKAYLE